MDGFLLVDKPAGWTSHDVVAKVRSTLRQLQAESSRLKVDQESTPSALDFQPSAKLKVGHAGTLDPFATGLLILLIGSYTKRAAEFLKLDKTYEVTLKLGEASTTGDPEGEIRVEDKGLSAKPTRKEVNEVISKFTGETMQTPPAYSAIKVGGQRAYKLARQGKEVKLEPRKVKIYQLRVTSYQFPLLSLKAKVSSGTYIRSLVQDIGGALGVGAYCAALKRTRVGRYDIGDAISVEGLTGEIIVQALRNV